MKKKLGVTLAALVALGGGGFAFWKFKPPTQVAVAKTDAVLKKGDAFPHDRWTKVLKKFDRAGYVDYAALKADPAEFNAYLGFLAKYSPQSTPEIFPRREDQIAYALNAYNAYIVKAVVDHFPVKSVKDIGLIPFDVFSKLLFPFGNSEMTLKEWESWVRTAFNEPRVHFALNCASIGCPRLPEEAFDPDRLEEQLAREAKKFVNEERNVQVVGSKLMLSSIFKWYAEDFIAYQNSKGKPASVQAFIRDAGKDVPDGEIGYQDYDWKLNGR